MIFSLVKLKQVPIQNNDILYSRDSNRHSANRCHSHPSNLGRRSFSSGFIEINVYLFYSAEDEFKEERNISPLPRDGSRVCGAWRVYGSGDPLLEEEYKVKNAPLGTDETWMLA